MALWDHISRSQCHQSGPGTSSSEPSVASRNPEKIRTASSFSSVVFLSKKETHEDKEP